MLVLPIDSEHQLEDHAVALHVKGLDLHHVQGHYSPPSGSGVRGKHATAIACPSAMRAWQLVRTVGAQPELPQPAQARFGLRPGEGCHRREEGSNCVQPYGGLRREPVLAASITGVSQAVNEMKPEHEFNRPRNMGGHRVKHIRKKGILSLRVTPARVLLRLSSKRTRVAVAALLMAVSLAGVPRPANATIIYNPPWADIMSGPMWGGVITSGYGDQAVGWLKTIGYSAFDDDNNTTPTQSLSSGWAQADAVWAAIGHAGPGHICIESGGHLGIVRANNQAGIPSTCSYWGAADIYSMPVGSLNRLKLMAFIGCETGRNSTGPYSGNLVSTAFYQRGVDSAIGFNGDIYSTSAPLIPDAWGLWNDGFWHELANGGTVSGAWYAGAQDVYFWWGQYFGFDSAVILGGSVRIKPAGYGV